MKYAIFTFLVCAIVWFGCKKPSTPAPPITPTTITHVVTIDTVGFNGFGQITPLSYIVNDNSSLSLSISIKPGDRISSYVTTGTASASAEGNKVTLSNITSDVTLKVQLTDSLTTAQLSQLKVYLQIKWVDRADSSRVTKQHIFGWQEVAIPPCAVDYYFGWIDANGDYEDHAGAHPCTAGMSPYALLDSEKQTLAYNGKTLTGSSGPNVIQIVKLTDKQFVYMWINPVDPKTGQPSGYDYIHYATPR
jgi:hypothetical protein